MDCRLDKIIKRNGVNASVILTENSRVKVHLIKTYEEWMMAKTISEMLK